MIVIIAPEVSVTNETELVNSFFENGLDFFHVRKYGFSNDEMQNYLNGIDKAFRTKIVLHSHFFLAKEFGINRIHFKEEARINKRYVDYKNYQLSTSVHCIEDFNKLSETWRYAFLSPVFPSISKPDYGCETNGLNNLEQKNNSHVQLIALGGIQPENCRQVIENGADGFALLGSIWQSNNPLNTFLQCKKNVQ